MGDDFDYADDDYFGFDDDYIYAEESWALAVSPRIRCGPLHLPVGM